jgi:hypothetical protein
LDSHMAHISSIKGHPRVLFHNDELGFITEGPTLTDEALKRQSVLFIISAARFEINGRAYEAHLCVRTDHLQSTSNIRWLQCITYNEPKRIR